MWTREEARTDSSEPLVGMGLDLGGRGSAEEGGYDGSEVGAFNGGEDGGVSLEIVAVEKLG